MRKHGIVSTALALVVALPVAAGDVESFDRIAPDELSWEKLRPGLSIAVLHGDPSSDGFYVIRAKFQPGTFSQPHFHENDRIVTVINGTWWTGIGAVLDKEGAVPLTPGSVMKHPGGGAHYDGAKEEEVIVQISGIGPADLIYVDEDGNPVED